MHVVRTMFDLTTVRSGRTDIQVDLSVLVGMMIEAMADDCEIWTQGTTGKGYPAARKDGRIVYVKRALWEKAHGPIPDGTTVRSRCGNRLCVNVDHLYLDRPGRLDAPRVNCRFARKDAKVTDPPAS